MKMQKRAKKQGGFVMTSELILIATILVIGLIVGMVTVRDAVLAELEDTAEAIGSLDQSYAFQGVINAETSAGTAGSTFGDAPDIGAGDLAEYDFVALDNTEGDLAGTIPASAGANSTAAGLPGGLVLGVH